ncbi:LamG domain-containing protein [Pseudorhodoferax sp.]|uniref:LamG domain-containing protein n=1 Tax=Pseudorhodoferax sp. TaxID=1993553 RepID=UPI002DD61F79|nr:LamG-like jellyroll fold domain-containing protein [Pseudorhodoferax sp.]
MVDNHSGLDAQTTRRSGYALGGRRFLTLSLADFPRAGCTFTFWVQAKSGGTVLRLSDGSETRLDAVTVALDITVQDGIAVSVGASEVRAALAPDGEAHHVAVSVAPSAVDATRSDVAVFVDGVQRAAASVSMVNGAGGVATLPAGGQMTIGATPTDPGGDDPDVPRQLFDGVLTDLRVWAKVLAAAEVSTDFMATVTSAEPQLYLALPLDSDHLGVSSSLARDLSPNQRHAAWASIRDRDLSFGVVDGFAGFPLADRTLAMWVRGDGSGAVLASYGDVSGSSRPNDGGVPWRVAADHVPPDDHWHHWAVVTDTVAQLETVYVDGEPAASHPVSGGQIDAQALFIGALRRDDPGSVFRGDVSDITLWNVALAAVDVRAEALQVAGTVPDSARIAHWPAGSSATAPRGPQMVFSPTRPTRNVQSLMLGGRPQAAVLAGPAQAIVLPESAVGAQPFSVEAWVRPKVPGPVWVGRAAAGGAACMALSVGEQGVPALGFHGLQGAAVLHLAAPAPLLDGEWHHLALTRDTAGVRIFVDGAEVLLVADAADVAMGAATSFTFGAAAAPIDSGLLAPGIGAQFTGGMTELRLWTRALGVGEVRGGMHHSLRGDEPGLVGRYGFEHGSGRDTSQARRHAQAAPGVDFTFDVPDLEPRDQPYLVVQTKLMEDYHFAPAVAGARAPAPTLVSTYRVVVKACNAAGQPLPGLPLSIALHDEPFQPTEAVVWTTTATGTVSTTVTSSSPVTVTTNPQGSATFAVPATMLACPVFAVSAAFMADGHALLVFPDRHAHDHLSAISAQELLGQPSAGSIRKARAALLPADQVASAQAVAQAVNHLMSAASDRAVQSANPVVRARSARLLSAVAPARRRRYENPYVSFDPYQHASNVSAGQHATRADAMVRQVVPRDMPSWQLSTDANGALVYRALDGAQARSAIDNLAFTFSDPLVQLLLPTEKRSEPITLAALHAALDDPRRERWFFDFIGEIVNAAKVVFHTIVAVVDGIAEAVSAVVVVVVDALGAAKAAVVDTVYKAANAVAGVFEKAKVKLQQVIEFVKDLFDWSDVVESQRVIEAQLRSVMSFVQRNQASAGKVLHNGLANLKAQAHGALASLAPAAVTTAAQAGQAGGAYAQPADVRASYVEHLFADHVSSADSKTPVPPDPVMPDGVDGDPMLAVLQALVGTANATGVGPAARPLSAPANVNAGLDQIAMAVVDVLKGLSDTLFDLVLSGSDAVFVGLAEVIGGVDRMLGTRLEIPLVTTLFEEVIVPGSTLTAYSLGALAGALPATFIYKIANGASTGPFHGFTAALVIDWPFDADGRKLSTRDDSVPTEDFIRATWGLGGAFVGLTVICGVVNVAQRRIPRRIPWLSRLALALGWLFQLSQCPLDAYRRIRVEQRAASAWVENFIWLAQFFPVVVDTVAVAAADRALVNPAAHARAQSVDSFRAKGVFVFGLFHAVSFVVLLAVEAQVDKMPASETWPKFIGNLSSCVSEISAIVDTAECPWVVVVDAVTLGAFGVISVVRYGIATGAEASTLMRGGYQPR